jgi:hypothetical protein
MKKMKVEWIKKGLMIAFTNKQKQASSLIAKVPLTKVVLNSFLYVVPSVGLLLTSWSIFQSVRTFTRLCT